MFLAPHGKSLLIRQIQIEDFILFWDALDFNNNKKQKKLILRVLISGRRF